MKRIVYISFLALMLVCASGMTRAFAIGDLGLGINIGLMYNPTNIGTDIDDANLAMEYYKSLNPGTSVKQLTVPFAPIFGINIRYQFNYIMLRLGGLFLKTLVPPSGSITNTSGVSNTVKIDTYQVIFPVTFAFLVPVAKRTHLYFGGGANIYLLFLGITQSSPGNTTALDNFSKRNYSTHHYGFHFIFGAEIPLPGNFSLTAEWMHFTGKTGSVTSSDSGASKVINYTNDIVLLGVTYYFSL